MRTYSAYVKMRMICRERYCDTSQLINSVNKSAFIRRWFRAEIASETQMKEDGFYDQGLQRSDFLSDVTTRPNMTMIWRH